MSNSKPPKDPIEADNERLKDISRERVRRTSAGGPRKNTTVTSGPGSGSSTKGKLYTPGANNIGGKSADKYIGDMSSTYLNKLNAADKKVADARRRTTNR